MTTKDEKDTKAPAKRESTSGADEALIAKGERTGKAVGPDQDPTFHVYEFDEPK